MFGDIPGRSTSVWSKPGVIQFNTEQIHERKRRLISRATRKYRSQQTHIETYSKKIAPIRLVKEDFL